MSNYWTSWHTNRMRRRRFIEGAGAVGLGVGGFALAGCGDDDDKSKGNATATAAPAGSPATAMSNQKRGGTLKMMDSIGSDVFDPAITIHAGSIYMGVIQVYEGLNRTTTNFKVEPQLAGLPEQVNDTTLIYKLQPGVKWQPTAPLNGRPFTAADAIFGIDRLRQSNPEFTFGSRFSAIDKMEAPDDRTLRITTKEPFAPLVVNIAEDSTLMVAKEAVEKFGDAGLKLHENMMGTGAFMPGGFEQGVRAKLVKNPAYWQQGKPYLDGIEVTQITDAAQREAAIVSGQVDMNAGWGMSTLQKDADAWKGQLGDKLIVEPKQLVGRLSLHFHTQKPPFNDPRIRRALHLAADRGVMDAATGKNHQLMGPVPQHIEPYGLKQTELAQLPGYRADKAKDIADAKALLNAAGKGSGFAFTMVSPTTSPVSEVLQQNWKAIGVEVTFKPVPTAEWITTRANGNFDVVSASITEAADPDQALYGANHTKGSVNFGKLSDPDVDKLAESQRRLFNATERKKVTDELQAKLLELSPQIWTFSYTFRSVRRSYVKDFKVVPGYQGWVFADTWLDK